MKEQSQSLCDNQALDKSRRQEVQGAVKHKEEQWTKVLKAAEEVLNKAETEAASEKEFDAFKAQTESVQSWIKEQKQKLMSLGSYMQFEERLQIAQVTLQFRFDLKISGCKVEKIRIYNSVSELYFFKNTHYCSDHFQALNHKIIKLINAHSFLLDSYYIIMILFAHYIYILYFIFCTKSYIMFD